MTSEVEPHILEKYDIKKRLGKGAYGIVWKVIDKKTQDIVALKKIFDAFRNKTDAQRTFREIAFLRQFHGHPNIIKLYSVMKAENDKDIYLTFEFMETDLHNVIKRGNILKDIHKQYIMYQLLKATKYLHSANVIHRDQKPSNVLLDSDCFVKLCDFGLARSLSERDVVAGANSAGQSLQPQHQPAPLTEYVATRWYRAPEILMASHRYTKGVDIWSLGCILGEMVLGKALFPGKSTVNQIELILNYIPKPEKEDIETMVKVYGARTITNINVKPRKTLTELVPNADSMAMELMKKMLHFNPDKRITIDESLEHPYLKRFHNPDEELSMDHDVVPPVDDDIQLSVEEYRSKLYKFIQQNKAQKKAKKRASAKLKAASAGAAVGGGDRVVSSVAAPAESAEAHPVHPVHPVHPRPPSPADHYHHQHHTPSPLHEPSESGYSHDRVRSGGAASYSSSKESHAVTAAAVTAAALTRSNYYGPERESSASSGLNLTTTKESGYRSGSSHHQHKPDSSSFDQDPKLQQTISQYNNFLESSKQHERPNTRSKSQSFSKSMNGFYDSGKRTGGGTGSGSTSVGYYGHESGAVKVNGGGGAADNSVVRKSQYMRRTAEQDMYRKSMFSPAGAVPGSNHASSYEVRNNSGNLTINSNQTAHSHAGKYEYEPTVRPRSRSMRTSYSHSGLDGGSNHNRSGGSGDYVGSSGYYDDCHGRQPVPQQQQQQQYRKTNSRSGYRSNSNSSNNNNSSIYEHGRTRTPNRGLNSTWADGRGNTNSDLLLGDAGGYTVTGHVMPGDPKRYQSAPTSYATVGRPPTSGLAYRDVSGGKTRSSSSINPGNGTGDYNSRMMARARAPSTKLDRNPAPTGGYYRTTSPSGQRYLSSESLLATSSSTNQRPRSRTMMATSGSNSLDDGYGVGNGSGGASRYSRASPSFGSMSGNQLAHYYSRRWIS